MTHRNLFFPQASIKNVFRCPSWKQDRAPIEQEVKWAKTDRGGRRTRDHRRMIRREMVREKDIRRARASEGRLDFEGAVRRPSSEEKKTILSPLSTVDSELGRSGNGLSPDQR
ncbi:hypothetical protein TNCV_1664921 [Trichonephila clavipes]|uniref:Uncharacterized protein n=1 Tax=Trichonephila clavipes TaxID=2585209 RepID=A0A8X6S4N8_TRICX|nr:hypothetical protein TNCV_1664921 [Trichonephila clavipes]